MLYDSKLFETYLYILTYIYIIVIVRLTSSFLPFSIQSTRQIFFIHLMSTSQECYFNLNQEGQEATCPLVSNLLQILTIKIEKPGGENESNKFRRQTPLPLTGERSLLRRSFPASFSLLGLFPAVFSPLGFFPARSSPRRYFIRHF